MNAYKRQLIVKPYDFEDRFTKDILPDSAGFPICCPQTLLFNVNFTNPLIFGQGNDTYFLKFPGAGCLVPGAPKQEPSTQPPMKG